MSYVEQWNAIAARIRSLGHVAELYAQFLVSDKSDGFSVGKELVNQSRSILDALKHFQHSFHVTLPSEASRRTAISFRMSVLNSAAAASTLAATTWPAN